MLHDTSRTFGTQNTFIHRMGFVALNILYLTVLHVNIDAAAAGTHVTGGATYLVTDHWRGVQLWLMMLCHTSPKVLRLDF